MALSWFGRPRDKVHRPQTRKRRENNEESLEKMRQLRQNLLRGYELLAWVTRREEFKRNVAVSPLYLPLLSALAPASEGRVAFRFDNRHDIAKASRYTKSISPKLWTLPEQSCFGRWDQGASGHQAYSLFVVLVTSTQKVYLAGFHLWFTLVAVCGHRRESDGVPAPSRASRLERGHRKSIHSPNEVPFAKEAPPCGTGHQG